MVDFSYSEEQQLLKDSVERFAREQMIIGRRRELVASDDGFSRDNWAKFAELGWLAVPFSEASGGLGGGPLEVMVLMEAFGRGLALEPFLATVLLGGGFHPVLRVQDGGEWRLDMSQSYRHLMGLRVRVVGIRENFDLLAVEKIGPAYKACPLRPLFVLLPV